MAITTKANDISDHKIAKLARAFHKVRFLDHFWHNVGQSPGYFFIQLNQNEDFRSQLIDSMLFGADRPKDQAHDPVDDYFLDF